MNALQHTDRHQSHGFGNGQDQGHPPGPVSSSGSGSGPGPEHSHSHAEEGAHEHHHRHYHHRHHKHHHQRLVDANRSYFDEQAASYDSRHGKMLERLTAELRARLDFIGVDWANDNDDEDEDEDEDTATREATKQERKQVRMLDYACGTGMMSRALAPYVTQTVGIDVSANMVAAYNARVENQGIPREDMNAVQGDLAAREDPDPPALSGPEFRAFDLAVVGGGFHHFDDPGLAAVRLAERLRPGGVLLVWDFMPHGPSEGAPDKGGDGGAGREKSAGDASHTITHHGFTAEGIRTIFERAGLRDFRLAELGAGFLSHGHGAGAEENRKRRVFLARGQKAA